MPSLTEIVFTKSDLDQLIRPFLRIDPPNVIREHLEACLRVRLESIDDAVCQNLVLVSYKGFRIDIRGIHRLRDDRLALGLQLKAKRKWLYGIFFNQTADLVDTLQEMCMGEMDGLEFRKLSLTNKSPANLNAQVSRLTCFHDSRALNAKPVASCDLSPLLITTYLHSGYFIVELRLNSLAYERVGSKSALRSDWSAFSNATSHAIERAVNEKLGSAAIAERIRQLRNRFVVGDKAHIPQDWLQKRVIERDLDDDVMQVLRDVLHPDDQLWRFSSPIETWQHMFGRGGIAIVRGGKVVAHLVTMMN